MRTALSVALLVLLLVSVSCRVIGGTASVEDLDAWEFPASVGGFVLLRVERDPGKEVIAGYNFDSSAARIAMTVFVYEAPQVVAVGSDRRTMTTVLAVLTKQEFEESMRSIEAARPHAQLVVEGPVSISQRGEEHPGHLATYEFREPFAGQVQDLTSLLYVFRDGPWIVKYRVTYPTNVSVHAEPAIAAFLQGLHWP